MSCCVVALMLIYQMIEGVRRMRAFLGVGANAPADAAIHRRLGRGVVAALRKPWLQFALLAILAIEGAAAGALAYEHRHHLRNEVSAVVFNVSGFALDLCRVEQRDGLL